MATAVRCAQRHRATGSIAAKRQGIRVRWRPNALLEQVAEKSDAALRRLVAELGERSVATSYGSVWRIVREAGIT